MFAASLQNQVTVSKVQVIDLEFHLNNTYNSDAFMSHNNSLPIVDFQSACPKLCVSGHQHVSMRHIYGFSELEAFHSILFIN